MSTLHRCMILATALALAAVPALLPHPLSAQQGAVAPADSLARYSLEPVVVEGRSEDLRGRALSASQGFVGAQDLRLRPLVREGELLESVPGVIMTQHSGDGKSNQMFVRGFNLDHGTDFASWVEGMPVNMVSHAHGQGYTDLNFLIPELVEHVEYKLGSYDATQGDFSAAGSARFQLLRSLEGPITSLGLGEHGYQRIMGATGGGSGSARWIVGIEGKRYDGPWTLPQDLRKLSGMARLSWGGEESRFSLLALTYDNQWDATDQVPLRAIESGTIGRFSPVDPTLGGLTSRHSLSASWSRSGASGSQRIELYGILYDLDLFSNFTYFLGDPALGDQFRQEDRGRTILGGAYRWLGGFERHTLTWGMDTRLDLFDVALSYSRERATIEAIREDEGTQWSAGLFGSLETRWNDRLRTVIGLRGDHFSFDIQSDLAANSGTSSASLLSPKGSLILTTGGRSELYLSGGLGFHSNDARGAVQSVDPGSGEAVDPVDPLVRSIGGEIGVRLDPTPDWRSTLALWTVQLDSELLFVGDEGTTEASDGTRRVGITWTNFHRLSPSLALDLDLSLSRGRFLEVEEGGDHIPGALEQVVAAGIRWEPGQRGPFAALRLRHFGEYPLIEDNSERAEAASLLNLNLGWRMGRVRIAASILNLLDTDHQDIVYLYESRLSGEPLSGVEDRHVHPVEPRQLRLEVRWGG